MSPRRRLGPAMSSRAALRGALRRASAPLTAAGGCCRPLPAPAAAPAAPARRAALSAAASSSSSSATSETAWGILQLLEERQAPAGEETEGNVESEGRVLSSAGGLLRVSLLGRVALGDAVELPQGLGLVTRYDRRGALVAVVAGATAQPGDIVRVVGALTVGAWPTSGANGGRAHVASAEELLQSGGPGRPVLALPAMPAPPSRRPVTRRLPSGLAAIEALLPLGEGHRLGLVGPPTTGKSRAAAMLIRSQSQDTAVVYAAQRTRAVVEHTLGQGVLDRPNLHVLYADPVTSSAGLRYLLPLCALQLATRLRAKHRHVLLVLDDLSAFVQAASELGTAPLGAPHVVCAALDTAGNFETADGMRALSVAVVADFDPEDGGELHPTLRNLWRNIVQSLDVHLSFTLQLAADGILPAIDVEQLLACGPPPVYQAPFFKALRGDLLRSLLANRDRRERLEMMSQLALHLEPQDQEDQGSAVVARALFAHAAARPLPELAVVLTAAMVFHFPLRSRKPSRTSIASFQDGILSLVRDEYPALWAVLQHVEEMTDTEAAETLQQLARALLAHRLRFQLTRPEL